MGTLLYQWSTAAQLVSVLMIATFFATLSRAVKRFEVANWAAAWWFNFAAVLITVTYWFSTVPPALQPVMRAMYVGFKATSAVLLVNGAVAMLTPGRRWMSRRAIAITLVAGAATGAFVLDTIDRIGIGTQGALGILLLGASVPFLGERKSTNWLGLGLFIRGAFSVIEGIAYYVDSLSPPVLTPDHATTLTLFLGAHSSIDLACDWLLALGGVLAIARRIREELERANKVLLVAQEELRRLADRDPLTGLANRRALPDAFRMVYDTGAAIVFFDLDGFKAVNDTLGHAAGDAYLLQFATALRDAFRPTDEIIRFGGDEFVVVAPGMSLEMAAERLEQLRGATQVRFSAGLQLLEAGADGDAALKAADETMYAQKMAGQRGRPVARLLVG